MSANTPRVTLPTVHPLQVFKEVGIPGLLDIALMSAILYAIFIWFKRRRAFFVLAGIAIVGLVYLAARQFSLTLTSFVLQSFFTVIFVALIIIFQEELKYFFEQVAVWSLNRKFRAGRSQVAPKVADLLARTLADLSKQKIGALLVLKGRGPIDRHTAGGFDLDGEISEPLLKSIFDPHSIGHDGAVIIDGDRVVRFGCQLPLSRDFTRTALGGMRHAAAVGISELSDSLALVVSEETGRVSSAYGGKLEDLGKPGEVAIRSVLHKFYADTAPPKKGRPFSDFLFKNYREKILSFLITVALWYTVVHETRIIQKTYVLPVQYLEPSPELAVAKVTPSEVSATFSGPRHAFQFLDPHEIQVVLKLYNHTEGYWAVPLSEENVTSPKNTTLRETEPTMILVEIEKK